MTTTQQPTLSTSTRLRHSRMHCNGLACTGGPGQPGPMRSGYIWTHGDRPASWVCERCGTERNVIR